MAKRPDGKGLRDSSCSRLQLLVREGILGEQGHVAHGVKKMGAGEEPGGERERERERDWVNLKDWGGGRGLKKGSGSWHCARRINVYCEMPLRRTTPCILQIRPTYCKTFGLARRRRHTVLDVVWFLGT